MEQVAAELSVNLVSIKIPYGVTYIGKSAFSDCENLETIYIPGNVEMIDAGAFR
jgi:hypothetical protein